MWKPRAKLFQEKNRFLSAAYVTPFITQFHQTLYQWCGDVLDNLKSNTERTGWLDRKVENPISSSMNIGHHNLQTGQEDTPVMKNKVWSQWEEWPTKYNDVCMCANEFKLFTALLHLNSKHVKAWSSWQCTGLQISSNECQTTATQWVWQ